MLFLNFTITNFVSDDINFLKMANDTLGKSNNNVSMSSLITLLQHRYKTWSSRIVIETVLLLIIRHFTLWRILNSMVAVLFIYLLNYFFNHQKSYETLLVSIILFMLIPPSIFSNTGWVATTLNYFWPVTISIFGFYPFFKKLRNEKMNIGLYLLSLLCLFLGLNQEQVLICYLGISFMITIFLLFTGRI